MSRRRPKSRVREPPANYTLERDLYVQATFGSKLIQVHVKFSVRRR